MTALDLERTSSASGAPAATPLTGSRSAAYYVAEGCRATPAHTRICQEVLDFLAAFDLGHADRACRHFSARYLAAPNIGGHTGCVRYIRDHGAHVRVEYSIVSARMRPDGGEVVYTINPPGNRAAERRYVAILVADEGPPRLDAATPVDG